jgi:hypothetical protein
MYLPSFTFPFACSSVRFKFFLAASLALGLAWGSPTHSQAQLNPVVVADTLLCPTSVGIASVAGTYDSLQWYRRFFGSTDTVALTGETNDTLLMDAFGFSASYVSVQVWLGAASAWAEEVLVDGWAFLPIFVMSEGDFTIGDNGEFLICPGDTVLCEVGSPYDTHLQWYNQQGAIAGATEISFPIVEPGEYWVEGAPAVCPDYLQTLGVTLTVAWAQGCDTTTALRPTTQPEHFTLYPNPSQGEVHLTVSPGLVRSRYAVWDASGRRVLTGVLAGAAPSIRLQGLPAGVYVLQLLPEAHSLTGTRTPLSRRFVLE